MPTPDSIPRAMTAAELHSGYRALYEGSPQGMLSVSLDEQIIVEGNPAFYAMLGYRASDLVGRSFLTIHPAADHDWIQAQFAALISRRATVVHAVPCLHKDGHIRFADIRAAIIEQGGTAMGIGIFSDVTEMHELLRERERMLAEAESARRILLSVLEDEKHAHAENVRLVAAIEQAAESVVITDLNGRVEYVNPAFERISGYTRAEVYGQHTRILKSGRHDAAFYTHIWQTIRSGQVWSGRMVNRRKNGELYTEDATISPVLDSDGALSHFVAVKRDISREIEVERQLAQSQKMEVVGQLAGGVAHDFNNLLQTILGFTEMAQSEKDLAVVQESLLPEIRRAGESAAALTRQLLAFSRRQVLEKQPVDLNELIDRMGKMIRRIIGEDITLILQMNASGHQVLVDPGQFEQVLLNLIINARDAMPEGGQVTVTTGVRRFSGEDEHTMVDSGSIPAGTYVQLSVADTGQGMSAEVRTRIFEPFFTTKAPGKGTGLGLATVFGIIKQHGGWITVYSEPQQGTDFHIYLPALKAEKSEPAHVQEERAPPRGRGEKILLVEDESMIRLLMERLLSRHGYQVTTAALADNAEQLFDAENPPFDLVCSDIVLPGRSGFSLVESLKAKRPDIRVLMVSGYTDERTRWPEIRQRGWQYLQKPISAATLLTTLRAMLDERINPAS
jgi:PAS domain S-box-containing protein